MTPDRPNNDGPLRFTRNWLMFDESRPARPQLLRKFIAVVALCLVASALLAILNAFTR